MYYYIYISHDGFSVYVCDYLRPYEEIYCPSCDQCDILVTECYNEEEVKILLKLLCRTYDLYALQEDYDTLVSKYDLEEVLNGESDS